MIISHHVVCVAEGRPGNGRGGGWWRGLAARSVLKAASSHSTQFWPPPSQYNNDNDDDDNDDGDDDDDDDDNDDDDNDSGLFCSLHPTPRNASYIHAHFSKVKSRATFRPFFCLSFLFLSFILIVWLFGWLVGCFFLQTETVKWHSCFVSGPLNYHKTHITDFLPSEENISGKKLTSIQV